MSNEDRLVRVAVLDVWGDVPLTAPANTSVAEIKTRALSAAHVNISPSEYLVKFRGAELRDENQSLASVGIPTGGALIVMPRRRRAVR